MLCAGKGGGDNGYCVKKIKTEGVGEKIKKKVEKKRLKNGLNASLRDTLIFITDLLGPIMFFGP